MGQSAEPAMLKEASDRVRRARTAAAANEKKVSSLQEQLDAAKAKQPDLDREFKDADRALDAAIKKHLPSLLRQSGDTKLEIAAIIAGAMADDGDAEKGSEKKEPALEPASAE